MQAPPQPKSGLGYYRLLSPTAAVRVSPLCLGAMSFGTAWKAMVGECNKEDTFKILDTYYENGGNFIDTANVYHNGESEQWIGEWMKARGNREEMVIATKYTGPTPLPSVKIRVNLGGNHTKSLLRSLEKSLETMQTSYVDLLMQALNRLVNAGKVHYLGISDAPAWVALKANLYAERNGLAQFSVYQGLYSAAVRDCEREILPVCEDTGMAFLPYGSQGGGKFRTLEQKEAAKAESGRNIAMYQDTDVYANVTEVLNDIAQRKGMKITQVALAWALQRTPYVFPIIGCRKLEYLQDAIEALTIQLSAEECDQIDCSSKFEPGFPISFLFQHFDTSKQYKPSMTAKHAAISQAGGRLDIVAKPEPIAPHGKEEYGSNEANLEQAAWRPKD